MRTWCVNRSPIAGTIADVRYQKGRFLVASKERASSENEQNTVVVQGDDTRVTFKQIAGLLARRIVFTKKIGETVGRGERVGLIKFGSRTEVLIPAGDAPDVMVKVGEKVYGGTTILLRFKS